MAEPQSDSAQRVDVDVIIDGGAVVTMDARRNIIRDGSVAVRADRIVAVGKRDDIHRAYRAARVIDARFDLVSPGFIDAHNHPIHYMTRGTLDDTPFMERQANVAKPYEELLSEDESHINAMASFVEMIENGTTCFHDTSSEHAGAIARAARDIGIRGVVGYDAFDNQPGRPSSTSRSWQGQVENAGRLVETWNGAAEGRIRAAVGLRGTSSERLCREIKSLADAQNLVLGSHMVVSRAQVDQPGFKSPVFKYHEMGLLGPNLCLYHLGYIQPQEIELFVSHDVKGVHSPARSMFGGGGFFVQGTIPDMIAAGMTIGLGTDAAAISRFLDMVRQMYLAACGHKETHIDARIMGAYKAFEMATLDSARAILWEDEIGSLEPGKKADVVILDMTAAEVQPNPFDCPIGNLVYSGTGRLTKTVMINGAIVMEDREFKTIERKAFWTEFNAATNSKLAAQNFHVKSPWPIN